LQEAMKFLTPLLEFSPENIEAQATGFEVFLRRKKYLLALKCLLAIHALDAANPTLHTLAYRFRTALERPDTGISPQVTELISPELKSLFDKQQSPSEWNESFINTNKSSASHVQSGLRVRGLLDKASREQNEKELIETLSLQGETLAEAIAGLELLEEWRSSAEAVSAYKQAAGSIWGEATAFKSK